MKVCVFDTETIGKVSQELLNVGYKIIDIDTETGNYKDLLNKDYLVSELYRNEIFMLNDDFVGLEKYAYYNRLIKDKSINHRYNIKKIISIMTNDLKKYNVQFAYAYNCMFDLDKFNKTCERLNIESPFNNIKVFDIWSYSRKYIVDNESYINYALENNLITEKGFISTSVESVCKYLYQDINFIESHTALDDTRHETYILSQCIKNGCDITKHLKYKRFFKKEDYIKE